MFGDEVIIETGLEVGEKVAAEGSFKIKYPGMLVTLPPAQGNGAPGDAKSGGEKTGGEKAAHDTPNADGHKGN